MVVHMEAEAARLFGLTRNVAIVTGANRGIGRAIARTLGALGASVVAVDVQSHDERHDPQESGIPPALAIQADVTRADQMETVIKRVITEFGALNVLVNNAGIIHRVDGPNAVRGESEEDWQHVLNVNLKGAFICSRAALPAILAQPGGRIINITSIITKWGAANIGASYGASKAGLMHLTKSLAVEGAPYGATANSVAPHAIHAGMSLDHTPEAMRQIIATVPLNRLGKPEEVAYAVAFLASPAAGFITGQTLHVNGGVLMID